MLYKEINELISKAGKVGKDLYSMTLFDYENDFVYTEANETLVDTLENIDNQVVKDFISNNRVIDSGDKTVSVLLYNDVTGVFFIYEAGQDVAKFTPELPKLIQNEDIEQNQIGLLKTIDNAGQQYKSALQKTPWKAGEPPTSETISDALGELLVVISAPDMPEVERPPMPWHMTPEELARAKENTKKMQELENNPEFMVSKKRLDMLAKVEKMLANREINKKDVCRKKR